VSTDIALHQLATPADVDLFVLQAYEAAFTTALTLAPASTLTVTPRPITATGGGGGGVATVAPPRPPRIPRPPRRVARRGAQQHRAALALAASMSLVVHPHGRRAEEELLLDLV